MVTNVPRLKRMTIRMLRDLFREILRLIKAKSVNTSDSLPVPIMKVIIMIDLTIHEEQLKRSIERARERNIIIPTFAQQKDPTHLHQCGPVG